MKPDSINSGIRAARILGAFLFVGVGLFAWADDQEAAKEPDNLVAKKEFTRGALIKFDGEITPILEQYFYRKLEKAKAAGVDLLIIEIDSPGGYVHTTLELTDRLRNLEWAHSVAYIPKQALSGAALFSLSCDEIVMGPRASIGDAGPIFQGEDAFFRHAPEKIRTDLVRRARDMAEDHGRPPAIAEAMVDMNTQVFRMKNSETGEQAFMSDAEIASSDNPDVWEKGPLVQESREGLFLEVNGEKAVELKLADATVEDRDDLVERYGLEQDLLVLETNGVDTTVMILNNSFVTGLLFVIGLIALYVEFSAPGVGVGGLTAGLCFALFFWSRFLGGTSGWLEVVLFVSALAFLGVELFVIPGFGVAGITGILLMLASVVMASQDFLVPQSGLEMKTLTRTLLVMTCSGIVFIGAAYFVTKHFGGIPVLNRLTLEPPKFDDDDAVDKDGKPVGSGSNVAIHVGDWGVADSPLRPAGKAVFGEEYTDVVTDGTFVEKGCQIRVVRINGNRIVVREIEQA